MTQSTGCSYRWNINVIANYDCFYRYLSNFVCSGRKKPHFPTLIFWRNQSLFQVVAVELCDLLRATSGKFTSSFTTIWKRFNRKLMIIRVWRFRVIFCRFKFRTMKKTLILSKIKKTCVISKSFYCDINEYFYIYLCTADLLILMIQMQLSQESFSKRFVGRWMIFGLHCAYFHFSSQIFKTVLYAGRVQVYREVTAAGFRIEMKTFSARECSIILSVVALNEGTTAYVGVPVTSLSGWAFRLRLWLRFRYRIRSTTWHFVSEITQTCNMD